MAGVIPVANETAHSFFFMQEISSKMSCATSPFFQLHIVSCLLPYCVLQICELTTLQNYSTSNEWSKLMPQEISRNIPKGCSFDIFPSPSSSQMKVYTYMTWVTVIWCRRARRWGSGTLDDLRMSNHHHQYHGPYLLSRTSTTGLTHHCIRSLLRPSQFIGFPPTPNQDSPGTTRERRSIAFSRFGIVSST